MTPVVENRSMSSDLGRSYSFGGQWGELNPWDAGLPAGLTYSSSNPDVAYIDSNGMFSALSPGTAVLTGVSAQDPGTHYTITVQVSSTVPWDYQIADTTLWVGQSVYHYITPYALYSGFTLSSTAWSSSDPSVVEVGVQQPDSCQLIANAAGTATISGTVTFLADTRAGTRTYTDHISFQVTVSAS